ncbi:very-short-patch-repair endonuclease [Pseudonocardia sediminis]|uniref:Very-short-patch-repair endonuclease n=1 Tax=Pseudonocardia sediminis TaxID=1397368 RepID=A0A4Q7UV87_PSEST|nr:DUF559 domain-containing protein [Pseudonocardia sediminis]RZT84954.1 very-short-patch-repair endonuclease [Pseudonocardia sediminis]
MSIEKLLLRQDGVIARSQARECGVSVRTLQRRVAAGEWMDLLPGVSLAGGHPLTDRALVRAAWLWGGPASLVSGTAAAFWHGLLDHAPPRVGLTVPRRATRVATPGVRLRRRDIAPEDRVRCDGIGLTGIDLTVLETAAVIADGPAFLDRALQRRRVGIDGLHRAYCRSAGAHGMRRAGMLLVAAADRADSAIERRLADLLRRAGITGFVLGHPFGDRQIDLAFPDARLAVEVDGWAWHTDTARFRADRRKGNDLMAAGWVLLRFTWHDVMDEPAETVSRVRDALARAA